MKKTLSLILALSLALLSACAGKTEDGSSPAAADPSADAGASASADAAGTPEETEFTADSLFTVQKTDYQGKTFHLLTTETQQYEFDAEEYTGEGVNDAISRRLASRAYAGFSPPAARRLEAALAQMLSNFENPQPERTQP